MSALIAPSDLLHVSESVASIAVVTTAVGLIALLVSQRTQPFAAI